MALLGDGGQVLIAIVECSRLGARRSLEIYREPDGPYEKPNNPGGYILGTLLPCSVANPCSFALFAWIRV